MKTVFDKSFVEQVLERGNSNYRGLKFNSEREAWSFALTMIVDLHKEVEDLKRKINNLT